MTLFFSRERSPQCTVFRAMRRVQGLGDSRVNITLCKNGFKSSVRIKNLKKKKLEFIEDQIQYQYLIEKQLKLKITSILDKIVKQNSYRGKRHKQNLPVHRQRTHTNARTSRRRPNLFTKQGSGDLSVPGPFLRTTKKKVRRGKSSKKPKTQLFNKHKIQFFLDKI